MSGDLNAKHVDRNSGLNTRRGKFLRDYTEENSCLIFGPDTPTTNLYNPSATPEVLDIMKIKEISFLVICLRALHEARTTSQYSLTLRVTHPFETHRIALISSALSGPNSKLTWKIKFRSIWSCTTAWQSTRELKTSPAPF